MTSAGILTISLDLELHWGVHHQRSLSSHSRDLLATRDAIPRLLDLFDRYGVHGTWATVGLLFFDRKAELMGSLPDPRPRYANAALSPYLCLGELGPNERQDPYHFGQSLIERIRDCPGQEIGTHTFSHYYCLEPGRSEHGQTADTFRADLLAARRAAERLGITPKSLVPPRNQIRADYLDVCHAAGIEVICSGNPLTQDAAPGQGLGLRVLREGDGAPPCSGERAHPEENKSGLFDLGPSHQIRLRSRWLRPLQLSRITAGLADAARNRSVYHLRCHTHDFGADPDSSFRQLERVLQRFGDLSQTYGMRSHTMLDAARSWAAKEPASNGDGSKTAVGAIPEDLALPSTGRVAAE
ncbi:MAG: polysaccharide deacetylase family protein [Pseudomonadota bacterium]